MIFPDQARAIVWAQFKASFHYFARSRSGVPLTVIVGLVWYGMWAFGALSVGMLAATSDRSLLLALFTPGLLLATIYWQVIPILMASTGSSLELRKLMVYPIPHGSLFSLEVLLRVTAAVEMILMVGGAAIGSWFNRSIPVWAPLGLIVFIAFNLLLSAGLRDLLGRILAHRRIREVAVVALVMIAALPQILLQRGDPTQIRHLFRQPAILFPWGGAADFAVGQHPIASGASLIVWTSLAYAFGRWQFERNLRFDKAAAGSGGTRITSGGGLLERLYTLPSRIFSDPLGALVEKEVRFLTRSPRFRLVFLMGFTFGILIWLPVLMRRNSGAPSAHYLTAVTVYGLMLLGEVCIWNMFGFDRSASQVYFAMPVRLSAVIVAKNVTALIFILLEAASIIVVCAALRMPITPLSMLEALAVMLTFTIFLLGLGNLISIHNPRAVDPEQSWRRSSAGRVQAFLILVYLIVALPISLAYLARFAFESEIAFYGVLAVDAMIAGILYYVALDSAIGYAAANKETILTALSEGEGPVA